MGAVLRLTTYVAVVILLSVASAWLMRAEWGDWDLPDPIQRLLGLNPK
jgi:hypothetical protein